MNQDKATHTVERAVGMLAGVATNRQIIKHELAKLPDDDPQINKNAVEYEIHLLRIVFTGWAVTYYMADHPMKVKLAEAFWLSMQEFAGRISVMASAGTEGKTVDCFGAIQERIQCYFDAMNANMTEADPAIVVGALLAQLCGYASSQSIAEAGRKVFGNTLTTVKMYLDTVEIAQAS